MISLIFCSATFALKMAPWIRINGSLNRRVLDKYMGTILLYCIENVGLTLFQLCTRFHYLPPMHIKELVQYLEDFECVTTTTFTKPKASLFSTYESSEIREYCYSQKKSFNMTVISRTLLMFDCRSRHRLGRIRRYRRGADSGRCDTNVHFYWRQKIQRGFHLNGTLL